MKDSELNKIQKKTSLLEGEMNYHLILFGDEIAKRENYKVHTGMDAIYYYLINKYHWLPQEVKFLDKMEIRFLLEEEMSGWTIPKEAKVEFLK